MAIRNRGPSSVAFSPDSKIALVTRDGDHKISILSVDGNKVEDTKQTMTGGFRPYAIQISPKGDVAVVGNQGGNTGARAKSRSMVDRMVCVPRNAEPKMIGASGSRRGLIAGE